MIDEKFPLTKDQIEYATKNAPDGAVAFAQDSGGGWWYYGSKPEVGVSEWIGVSISRCDFPDPNWREHLFIVPNPPIEEMTVAEVCKALSKQVKIVEG